MAFPVLWKLEFSLYCSLLSLTAVQRPGWQGYRGQVYESLHPLVVAWREELLVLLSSPPAVPSMERNPACWPLVKAHTAVPPQTAHVWCIKSTKKWQMGLWFFKMSKMPHKWWKNWQHRPSPSGDSPTNLRLQQATKLRFSHEHLPAQHWCKYANWPPGT